ncbi:hypothetical protein ABZ078_23370 [Streptomyces sp. NPDC006385]|uniref:hypothetical protein n=1 Tax=Streptomyces sp. NPDC006385 TaxID=3156761 RepID=UPI0033BEC425
MTTRFDDEEGLESAADDPLAVILRPPSAEHLAAPPGRYEAIRRTASRRRLLRTAAGLGATCAVAALVAVPLYFARPDGSPSPAPPLAPGPTITRTPPSEPSPAPTPSEPSRAPTPSASSTAAGPATPTVPPDPSGFPTPTSDGTNRTVTPSGSLPTAEPSADPARGLSSGSR